MVGARAEPLMHATEVQPKKCPEFAELPPVAAQYRRLCIATPCTLLTTLLCNTASPLRGPSAPALETTKICAPCVQSCVGF